MSFRISAVCLTLALVETVAYSETLPSFNSIYSTWEASHIVVIDAAGVVQESWKGDLAKGESLPIDAWMLPGKQKVHHGWPGETREDKLPEGAVREVSGKRRVVFLIRDPGKRGAEKWK